MKHKAFTLVEMLITLTVFSIVIASVLSIYINSQRAKMRVDSMTEAQQAARTAIDYMIKDIRAAGYNIDLEETATSSPQRRIVYYSPYEIVFNANIRPVQDDPANPKSPMAIDPTTSPKPVHYNPIKQFDTGAETIVYTLDYNGDGIVNSNDRNSPEARFTDNPNDYALVKMVFGYDTLTGTNGGTRQIVSVVGGPNQFPSQTEGIPIFMIWYDDDNDPSTDNKLWGDTNNDGVISQTEANALTGIVNPDMLDKIRMVSVKVTGLSSSKYNGEYLESSIQTDVSVTRNASINVQTIVGHVYQDDGDSTYSGEAGIPNVKVRLNTGEMTYTDSEGKWAFALISGAYSATCTPPVGYTPTSDLYFDFTIGDEDLDATSDAVLKDYFGLKTTPTANIFGFAYVDANGDSMWDQATDPLLGGVKLSVWNNSTITFDDPTDTSYGFYNLTVNAEETLYAWVTPPEGYSAICIDTFIEGMGSPASDPMNYMEVISPIDFAINMPDNTVKAVALGVVAAEGLPPYIEVLQPNGGEIYIIGEDNHIKVKVSDPENEPIQRFYYYYSIDAGNTWKEIGQAPYPSIAADSTFTYTWTITDSSETGSTICKVRVGVQDAGNWTIYDESDYYFTLVDEGGFKDIYFTSETADSLTDETVYLYALGADSTNVLPRYANPFNSYAEAIASDSFMFSGYAAQRRFWTQNSKFLEFITVKDVPYADTIFDGTWRFFLDGVCMDEAENLKYFEMEVHKRDSAGDTLSDTLLFSTLTNYNCNISYRDAFSNDDELMLIAVNVPYGFSINRSDRLYFKIFWSGYSDATGGQDVADRIYFYYGGETASRVKLPTK